MTSVPSGLSLSRRLLLRQWGALAAGLAVAPLLAACGAATTATVTTSATASTTQAAAAATTTSAASKAAGATTASAAPTPVTAHRDPVSGKGVTLEHWQNWSSPANLDSVGKAFDMFQKDHPAVGLTAQGYNQDKFVARVAGGDSPDSVTIRFVAPNATKGLYQALDDRISKSSIIKRDDFSDAQFKQVQWKGKTWGIPALENGPRSALVYNVDLFRAAGIDTAKPPTTWEDVAAVSQQLTKVQGDQITQLGFDPLSSMGMEGFLDIYGQGYGVQWYDYATDTLHLNDQGLVDAVNWVSSQYKVITPARYDAFRKVYGQWDGKTSGFDGQKEAMVLQGYWTPGNVTKPGQQVKILSAFYPTKSGRKMMLTGGWSLQILTGSKNTDQAFSWLEFLTTTPPNQLLLDETGLMLYTKKFAKEGKFDQIPDLDWFLQAVGQADVNINIPNNPIYDQIDSNYRAGLVKVRNAQAEPKAMLDDLQTRMQALLNQTLGKS